MTEPTETQDTEPDVPDVANVPEPDQEPGEPTPEEEEAEHEHQEQEQSEARGPAVDSEKEMRAFERKLTTERDRHSKKLGDILGDASTSVLPCPLCFQGMMGFVLPGDGPALPDEQRDAVLAFIGAEAPGELREAEGVVMCDRCDGWGELKYPSRKPAYANQPCPKCNGNGYVLEAQAASNVAQLPGAAPIPSPPMGEQAAPCPLCGAPNSAGRPHFCNPVAQVGT